MIGFNGLHRLVQIKCKRKGAYNWFNAQIDLSSKFSMKLMTIAICQIERERNANSFGSRRRTYPSYKTNDYFTSIKKANIEQI